VLIRGKVFAEGKNTLYIGLDGGIIGEKDTFGIQNDVIEIDV
jgi:hypothetical protein